MAKDKIMYVCDNCGQESAKWIGKCPACGQWNTFKEIKVADTRKQVAATSAAASAGHQGREEREVPRCHLTTAASSSALYLPTDSGDA